MQAKIITTQEFAPEKIEIEKLQQEQKYSLYQTTEVSSQTIDKLVISVREILSSSQETLNTEVQQEISKLLNVLQRAKKLLTSRSTGKTDIKAELATIVLNVNIAIDALCKNQSKILARTVRQDAEYAIRRLENPTFSFFVNSYQRLLNSSKVATRVLVGLLIALPLNLSLASYIISSLDSVETKLQALNVVSKDQEVRKIDEPIIYVGDFREEYTLVILSFICGSIGSIISIFSRIDEYSKQDNTAEYQGSQLPIFIGLFKPIIGGTFGILIYTIISSNMVPMVSIDRGEARTRTDLKWLTIMSVAFVAGFSERFAKDIVASTENQFSSAANLSQQQNLEIKMPIEQVDLANGSSQEDKQ